MKYYFAHEVKITGSPRLAEFYLQLIDSIPDEPLTQPLSTAKEYLQILTQSPKDTHYQLIAALTEQGWQESDIILLAQLTYVTYQARLIEGILY